MIVQILKALFFRTSIEYQQRLLITRLQRKVIVTRDIARKVARLIVPGPGDLINVDEPAHLMNAQFVHAMTALTLDDGSKVQLLCQWQDAPDEDHTTAIIVSSDFTGWDDRRYYGKTWLDAASKALADKGQWEASRA